MKKLGIEPGPVQETLIIYYNMGDPNVTCLHRFLARRCDNMVKMQVNRFDFSGEIE